MAGQSDRSLALAWAIWPLLLTAFVSTLPIVATSLFVAQIAADLQTTTAIVGGLRGLAGVAALLVGFTLAPLIDHIPRALIVTIGLMLIAVANILPILGSLTWLAAFYVLLGATMAVLVPTVQAASADRFTGPTAGEATSLVFSANALANMSGGAILALPVLIAGWRGAFVAMSAAALVMAVLCACVLGWRRPKGVARPGYRQAFAIVTRAPGAIPLLLTSTFRNCLWFAWLTYLAASFTERFGASTGLIAWVWFLGAGAFFVGNTVAGRVANPAAGERPDGWRSPASLLMASSAANVIMAPLVFVSPTIPLALCATGAFCVMSGISTATVISLLIRRYAPLRGAVMGLNAVGMNVGTFAGASLAGIGLGVGGYSWLAMTLVVMALAGVGMLFVALRTLADPGDAGPAALARA